MWHGMHLWKSEDNLWDLVLSFQYVVCGIKSELSNLAASAVTQWAISPAHKIKSFF